jgi:hypothetical protein
MVYNNRFLNYICIFNVFFVNIFLERFFFCRIGFVFQKRGWCFFFFCGNRDVLFLGNGDTRSYFLGGSRCVANSAVSKVREDAMLKEGHG